MSPGVMMPIRLTPVLRPQVGARWLLAGTFRSSKIFHIRSQMIVNQTRGDTKGTTTAPIT
jgi:hypothetical protein